MRKLSSPPRDKKITLLIKAGNYAQMKNICHYHPYWDPNDSIFNKNVLFIHRCLNKYGMPAHSNYKSSVDMSGEYIIRFYLNKVSMPDTTLDSAYVEIDYFSPDREFKDIHSFKGKALKGFLKLARLHPVILF